MRSGLPPPPPPSPLWFHSTVPLNYHSRMRQDSPGQNFLLSYNSRLLKIKGLSPVSDSQNSADSMIICSNRRHAHTRAVWKKCTPYFYCFIIPAFHIHSMVRSLTSLIKVDIAKVMLRPHFENMLTRKLPRKLLAQKPHVSYSYTLSSKQKAIRPLVPALY